MTCSRCRVEMWSLGGSREVELARADRLGYVRTERRVRELRCTRCLKRVVVVEEQHETLDERELELARREWRERVRSRVYYTLHGNFVVFY